MIDDILVPLDGSETAEAALAYVELLPSRRVRLLQIEPDSEGPLLADPTKSEAWRATREAEARAYLEQVGERLRQQGRTVEYDFAFGDPADWIIAFAGDADLIVMATHGRGGAERVLFGSVADRVARHAPVSTLLVRGLDAAAGAPQVARVIVPLDGSTLADRALPVAAAVARDLGVPIHLLRVLDDDLVRASVEAGIAAAATYARSRDDARREAREDLEARAQTLRNQDITASIELLTGSPAGALLDAIAPADLVVMTTHGRSGVRRWLLGSVADKLVREAGAPVLLVRADSPRRTPPGPSSPTTGWS
jgi:nucleotide-binding universal stress UspA family protein